MTSPSSSVLSGYMTVKEVAKLLGLSPSGLYGMCANGTVPSVKLGRSVRIPRKWVDEQSQPTQQGEVA